MALRPPRVPKLSRSQAIAGWLLFLVGMVLATIAAIGWQPFGKPINLMLTIFFLASGGWIVTGVSLLAFLVKSAGNELPLTPHLRGEEPEE